MDFSMDSITIRIFTLQNMVNKEGYFDIYTSNIQEVIIAELLRYRQSNPGAKAID